MGPIKNLSLDLPFSNEGNPKPIIFVGENGSGKSLILSNIVDAFYEIAGAAYNDVRVLDASGMQLYYKAISNIQITVGQPYLCSYIEFENGSDKIEYIFKIGAKAFSDYCTENSITIDKKLNWETKSKDISGNFKNTNVGCAHNPVIFDCTITQPTVASI